MSTQSDQHQTGRGDERPGPAQPHALRPHLGGEALLEGLHDRAEEPRLVDRIGDDVADPGGQQPGRTAGDQRAETGEGLEKKNEDFAAEVAKQMNM